MPPLSYRSPKAEVRPSSIHGNGLFAAQPIRVGEIVAVKGGYVFEASAWEAIEPALGSAEIQLSEDLFIAPARSDEREGSMIYTNHSCDPNIAVQGQIVFVAMRDIDAGEELTHDWATTDDLDYVMDCRCGSARCRGTVTGRDWRKRALQNRYRGRFCWFLQRKIDALTPRSPRLLYRALSGNEVALFHRLIVNEHVRRYLLDGKIMPESWSATEAEASERRHEEGLGLWLVSAAHRPDDVLGFCGYRVFADLDPRPQLLFAFVESATGQGFATETARAMIRLGRVAGLESIIAFVDAPNVASIRVLKKVGFVSTTAGPCTVGQRLCFEVKGAHKA